MKLLDVVAGKRAPAPGAAPPLWLMRQAGRYLPEYRDLRAKAGGFLELCYTPAHAAEVTLQPIRRFGFDAAILFSDILVVPDGLGQKVWFEAGEGPRLEPLGNTGIDGLNVGRVVGHLAPVYDAAARVRAELPHETALIGFAGAPWTVACYMIEGRGSKDWQQARTFALRDPRAFTALLDRLVAATVAHLSAQIDAGADAVQLFESWAAAVPADRFDAWVIDPTRAIASALRARHPGTPILGFPRGAGVNIPRYVAGTGVDAVSLDQSVPTAWARDRLPAEVAVQGNLDPVALLVGGEVMDAAVDRILADLSGRPFVFNLGHGVIKETPPEHVAQLVARVRERQESGGDRNRSCTIC